MTVLPSIEVYKLIQSRDLLIDPFELREEETPPASVDLRLSGKKLIYKLDKYTLGDEIPEDSKEYEVIEDGVYNLKPGEGAVFQIYEKIALPSFLIGIIFPRSSLTRLGVSLNPTYLNPGYQGYCPVLLVNHSPFEVKIPFKDGKSPRIAQVIFISLKENPHRIYGEGIDEKYQNDKGYHSRFYQDIDVYEVLRPLVDIVKKHGF